MQSQKIKYIKIKYIFFYLLFISIASFTTLFTTMGWAATTAMKAPLSVDQAFTFSISLEHPKKAIMQWHVAPGYYLYSQRTHVSLKSNLPARIHFPQGDFKYDPHFGQQEVYSGQFSVPILLQTGAKIIQLNVDYQGCSESGFCYPPMHKNVAINFVDHSVSVSDNDHKLNQPDGVSFYSLLTHQQSIKSLLGTLNLSWMLLIFTGIGLLLAFTPCVLPMIPILTSIIVGQKQAVSTKKAFFLSLAYVLGSATTYALAGLMAASMGRSLQVWLQAPWAIAITSLLFVLLAFSLFGFYDLRLPSYWQKKIFHLSHHQQGGSYVGVFLMGILSTLIVSPCVTAPLVGVLMYIGETGNLLLGTSALFAMGIGMGIPLLLIGTSAGKWLPKRGPWMEGVKKIVGVLMLGMAIWLASRLPFFTIGMLLLGVLLIGIAFYLNIYLPRLIKRQTLARGLGLIVGLSGIFVVVGSMKMSPMLGFKSNQDSVKMMSATKASHSFTVIHDIAEFNRHLSIAQAAHKPILLDFYADWCESCVTMDKTVFNLPDVKQILNHYVLLRADISANNAADEALLKYFDVIAPPTMLFFDARGQEMNAHRIVGEVNAKEFLMRLSPLGEQITLEK